MLDFISAQFEKTKDIKKSSYVWNAVNAMLSAAQCPLILMVLNRTNGIEDAGIFSIAFAVASLMLYIGLYGLRRFQASDINEKFSFQEYNGVRFLTCAAMVLASLGYCCYGMMFNDYSTNKAVIVFLVCLLKLVQAYTDVIHGNMQQKGRLDVATKCSALRYVLEVLSIAVCLVITKDLLMSLIVSVIVSFVVTFFTSINCGRKYCETFAPSFRKDAVTKLMIDGFPLFLSLFLNMYISNSPKYAIDTYLTDDIQAIYNMIFMPTYVVQMVTQFIFNPVLTVYAELWLSHDREKFKRFIKMIKNMCLAVLGLAVLAVAVAATIGIPVLSILFGTDLSEYKAELCIIMVAGGMLGYSIYFNMLLAVIRAQRPLIYCYGIVSIMAFLMSGFFVKSYGVMGAAVLYATLMTLLTVLLLIVTVIPLKKEWNLINMQDAELNERKKKKKRFKST